MIFSIKGHLDCVSSESIHGWCAQKKIDVPATVALYVNDKEISRTIANLPRPDVHLKGLHPTGACGFKFDSQKRFELNAGDKVSVKAIVNEKRIELASSPKIFPTTIPSYGSHLSRHEKIFIKIDTQGLGLEIGPSHKPLAPKSLGYNCKTLDHLDTESLRKKYANNSRVNINNIEEVDYVWKGEPLDQLIGERNCFDYIIASHVIEHTPDFLGFLKQCETLLKETGTLSLVIPDKRYCFDFFRWPSTTGDILQAHIEQRTLHTPGVIFDHFSSVCQQDKQIVWSQGSKGSFDLIHSTETAIRLMEKAIAENDYVDVHNWRFTPSSFRLILADLQAMSKIDLKEVSFYDTVGCEFYMSLQFDKSTGEKLPVNRLGLLKQTMLEIMESIEALKQ